MSVAIKKCEFYTIKTKFYRFIIKLGKLNMDLKKIKAVEIYRQKLHNYASSTCRRRVVVVSLISHPYGD